MIFSPWTPHQERVTPGGDYRAAKINGASENFGGFDAVRFPQFLEILDNSTGDFVALLERQHSLTGPINASVWQLVLGEHYGTEDGGFITDHGFWWFFDPIATFNGARSLVLYESIYPVDAVNGRKLYVAAGVAHTFAYSLLGDPSSIIWPEGYIVPDWRLTWSAWYADDIPAGDGGTPTNTFTGERWGYNIWQGPEAEFDTGAGEGSAYWTPGSFDLLRSGKFDVVLSGTDVFGQAVGDLIAKAWFPRLEVSN